MWDGGRRTTLVTPSLFCRTDKKRDTHTEMRWDTCDEEQHTCPRFDTLMANVSHLFRNMCRILSMWYHTISIMSEISLAGHNWLTFWLGFNPGLDWTCNRLPSSQGIERHWKGPSLVTTEYWWTRSVTTWSYQALYPHNDGSLISCWFKR